MATLPTCVYKAFNEAGIEMHGAKNRHKGLRQQIANLRNMLAKASNLHLMTLIGEKEQVYPVMITDGTGGIFGFKIMEYCFLGVNTFGEGCISSCATTFDDFLIYLCDYNEEAINYIFKRAIEGDPVSFDEVLQMDISSDATYQNITYNTLHDGQIINASGNARVNASVNVPVNIPPQFQLECNELINFLQNADETSSSKNLKINKFIEKLLMAGFGEIVGEIARFLFNLV